MRDAVYLTDTRSLPSVAERKAFMSEQLSLPLCVGERLHKNPLGLMLEKYVQYLFRRGYRRGTVLCYVSAVEHFGRWLGRRRICSRAVLRFLKDHLPTCHCKSPAIRCVKFVRA